MSKLTKSLKRIVLRIPIIRSGVIVVFRAFLPVNYYKKKAKEALLWLFMSRERTNFTYDLTESNKKHLVCLISLITGERRENIISYITEIENDIDLKDQIKKTIHGSRRAYEADDEVRFGRRIGWYCLVRIAKPKLIVETGVDKGLGSCVLTSALRRNNREGHPGHYIGTDINPNAGYLLSGLYKEFGDIRYGDSIETLKNLNEEIDFFINDSDHSAEYEAREYATIQNKLSHNAIILGDNSHVTDKLLEFSMATNRRFVFFKEEPCRHWYPGAGIGISFR